MSEWSFEERLRRNPMPTKLISKEENTRITGLTNQILIEFCKSKGHTLEEITEFVERLPNE